MGGLTKKDDPLNIVIPKFIDLKKGDKGDDVSAMQSAFKAGGYVITVDGDFGPQTESAVMSLQRSMGLKITGIYDEGTLKALVNHTPNELVDVSPSLMPWRDWFLARKGWTEFNHDKELSKGWALVGLPGYRTVIGTAHAWCGMSLATALHEHGYKILRGAAGAASWDHYGTPIDWKKVGIPKGAILRLRHPSGGAHVTTADRDHHVGESTVDCLGGNQGNSVNVTKFGWSEVVYCGWPIK